MTTTRKLILTKSKEISPSSCRTTIHRVGQKSKGIHKWMLQLLQLISQWFSALQLVAQFLRTWITLRTCIHPSNSRQSTRSQCITPWLRLKPLSTQADCMSRTTTGSLAHRCLNRSYRSYTTLKKATHLTWMLFTRSSLDSFSSQSPYSVIKDICKVKITHCWTTKSRCFQARHSISIRQMLVLTMCLRMLKHSMRI